MRRALVYVAFMGLVGTIGLAQGHQHKADPKAEVATLAQALASVDGEAWQLAHQHRDNPSQAIQAVRELHARLGPEVRSVVARSEVVDCSGDGGEGLKMSDQKWQEAFDSGYEQHASGFGATRGALLEDDAYAELVKSVEEEFKFFRKKLCEDASKPW